jgi:hypothetical protein
MQSIASVAKPRTLSDVLRYEVHPNFTREQEMFAGHGGSEEEALEVEIGMVVGKLTTGGKIVQHAPGASDGSQNAYGIALQKFKTEAEDVPGLVLVRGPAIVVVSTVIWAEGISDNNKNTAIAALAAKGIIIRAD